MDGYWRGMPPVFRSPSVIRSINHQPSAINLSVVLLLAFLLPLLALGAEPEAVVFPPALESYGDAGETSLGKVLLNRIQHEPLNLVATLLFGMAILHTLLAPHFLKLSHRWRREHHQSTGGEQTAAAKGLEGAVGDVSFKAEMMHFLGEIEAVFGIWVIPLLITITMVKGWSTVENYINDAVHFTEPMFVVVIMSIAATRPVLRFAEVCLRMVAKLGRETPGAWWLSILTLGPILGSLITEPAAMTICALLISRQIYDLQPSPKLAYATMGLLFVNVSVGGTLTHFAAPPVLMVAQKWGWDTPFMFSHFGWKAIVGIACANLAYFLWFRNELRCLHSSSGSGSGSGGAGGAGGNDEGESWEDRADAVPLWVTAVHLGFLAWTVFTLHYPALFIGGFLFFLAFATATQNHQNRIQLKPALLVGFFLAGLVVHGGLQAWWIAPVLTSLGDLSLLLGAAGLTAFNDNAAITYLATLVPNFADTLKYFVVAGAVAGGGLTVIANAPNPAGQSILSKYFPDGVSPLRLFLGALFPTLVMLLIFALIP